MAYAVALVLLIAATTGWIVFSNYRAHRDVNERLLSSLAAVGASQVEVSIRAIDLLLDDAARTIGSGPWPNDTAIAHLQSRLSDFPEVHDLIVVDASGRTHAPIVSAKGTRNVILDLQDREFFLHQQTHWAEDRLHISRAVVSRALNETVIPISRPVKSADGAFRGLVAVSLSAAHLDRMMASVASAPGSSGAIFRTDDVILARHPGGDEFRGRSAKVREQSAGAPAGIFHLSREMSLDDKDRLVAFRSLNSYPLVATASVPTAEAFQEWQDSALQSITIVLLLSAAVLALARTAERQAVALRHSAAIIASSDDAIIGTSMDGMVTSWNRSAERLFGYAASDIVGRSIQTLFPEDRVDEEIQIMGQISAGKTIAPFETIRRHRDGALVEISVSFSPIRDKRGRIIGVSSIAHDIADRRRAEEALRLSEARLSQIFRISPAAIAVSGLEDGCFRDVNDTFLTLFGYDRQEVIGQSSAALKLWENPEDRQSILAGLQRDNRVRNKDLRLRRKSGEFGDFIYSAAGIVLDGENYILSIVQDVTEYQQAKRRVVELRQSNTELEQFAYVASHDLREPLRMVTSYLGLLKQHLGPDLNGEAGEFIHFAMDGAKRMDALIHDLLEYSRVGHEAARDSVDLGAVVAEAVGNLTVAIDETSGTVETAPGLPTVLGDRYELMRLFQNLVANALKYRHPERVPKISIGWQDRGNDGWEMFVKDNGSGIEERNFERVFGIFQRLVARNACEGTGIGLAICRKIVEQHGGRIWLESTVGEGTTFRFTLPKLP